MIANVVKIRSGYGRKRSDRFVTDPATGAEHPTPEYLAALTRALNGEARRITDALVALYR